MGRSASVSPIEKLIRTDVLQNARSLLEVNCSMFGGALHQVASRHMTQGIFTSVTLEQLLLPTTQSYDIVALLR